MCVKNVEVTTKIIEMEPIASKDAEEKKQRNQSGFFSNKGRRGENYEIKESMTNIKYKKKTTRIISNILTIINEMA